MPTLALAGLSGSAGPPEDAAVSPAEDTVKHVRAADGHNDFQNKGANSQSRSAHDKGGNDKPFSSMLSQARAVPVHPDIVEPTASCSTTTPKEDSSRTTQGGVRMAALVPEVSRTNDEDCEALLWDAQTSLISHRYKSAVNALTRAAAAGSSSACLSLANIYHKGLPCTHHDHRKIATSPPGLVEGSIAVSPVKATAYLVQTLNLEDSKEDFADLDLEILVDAATTLCDMYRYGRIRPHDHSRASGVMNELGTAAIKRLSDSAELGSRIMHEIWNDGGHASLSLSQRFEDALHQTGYHWLSERPVPTSGRVDHPSKLLMRHAQLVQARSILVRLYYIVALVATSRTCSHTIEDPIVWWKRLLAFQNAYERFTSGSTSDSARPLVRRHSDQDPGLLSLLHKAQKRLDLLTQPMADHPTPARTSPRRLPSHSGSSTLQSADLSGLFSPVADSTVSFVQDNAIPSCYSPIPKAQRSLQASKTQVHLMLQDEGVCQPGHTALESPVRKSRKMFALHESPSSVRSSTLNLKESTKFLANDHASIHRRASSIFRGSTKQRLLASNAFERSPSLATLPAEDAFAPRSHPSHNVHNVPLGRVESFASFGAPSQISVATSVRGSRGWTSARSAHPLSQLSTATSASLHMPAPRMDRISSQSSVSSLPHSKVSVDMSKARDSLRGHIAPTRAPKSSKSSLAIYAMRAQHSFASLQRYFSSPAHSVTPTDSVAKSHLEKVARCHDNVLENHYWVDGEAEGSDTESVDTGGGSLQNQDSLYDSSLKQNTRSLPMSVSQEDTLSTALASHSKPSRPVLSSSISSAHLQLARRPPKHPPQSHAADLAGQTADDSQTQASQTTTRRQSGNLISHKSEATKIDPLLAALEAASRVNVKSECAVCGVHGINFPKCHKCHMTFCSRTCRIASGGSTGRHVCTSVGDSKGVP